MTIQAVRGTRDILPDEVGSWHAIEAAARELFARYGYREIRTPVFEQTELFARGIGAETDIVSKEMYTFADRDGGSLTLRPEATAGVVRAVIEHNLAHTDPALKLYALGPMFRRERPQKGRYRQFHQVDVEAFGFTSPTIDAEVIELALAYLDACGVTRHELVLNSVGDRTCRPGYVQALKQALRGKAASLCGDCQRRAVTNPLRIFDCKIPADQPLIDALPHTIDFLCGDCRTHFDAVRKYLDLFGVPWTLSHRLVRGLDYYTRTTFEVLAGNIGAQSALLGGGRYDGLVKQLGGPDRVGIGFAAGIERLVLALPETLQLPEKRPDVFVAALGEPAREASLALLRDLRRAGLNAQIEYEGRSLKSQMKRADRLKAPVVFILGEDELARGEVTVRRMAASAQESVPLAGAVAFAKANR